MLGVGTWNDLDVGPALEGLSLVSFPVKHLFVRIIGLGPVTPDMDFRASVLSLQGPVCVSHS